MQMKASLTQFIKRFDIGENKVPNYEIYEGYFLDTDNQPIHAQICKIKRV